MKNAHYSSWRRRSSFVACVSSRSGRALLWRGHSCLPHRHLLSMPGLAMGGAMFHENLGAS